MSRRKANMRLLTQLTAYLVQHPDVRFGQALVNLGIVVYGPDFKADADGRLPALDPFHEEPDVTLARVHQGLGGVAA